MASATQRTLWALKDEGRICEVVERWNPYAGKRQDLFGFIDIISVHHQRGVVGVQCFTSTWGEHVKKLKTRKAHLVRRWLEAAELELWGWTKKKMRNSEGKALKREVYSPRIGLVVLRDGELEVVE